MKCIYCLKEKDSACYKKVEHVLPQSFGKFVDNFTLKNIVCDECNQYFGNNLEPVLARDTFEGISRQKFNVKQPKDFKSLGKNSKLEIIVDEGPLKGAFAYLKYSETEDNVLMFPLPQIGFKRNSDLKHIFYKLSDIPEYEYLKSEGYNLEIEDSIIILGINHEEAALVLREKGINNFTYQGERALPREQNDYQFFIQRKIDEVIKRGVAKVAFNYLAYQEGADFVLDESFNKIRNFIMTGTDPEYQLVIFVHDDILEDELNKEVKRVGHIITVDWGNDSKTIFSQVSLFNMAKYVVLLSENYNAGYRNITKGHFFNVGDKRIYELGCRKD